MGCWVLASEKQMYKWQMNELKSKRLPRASISKYDSKCKKKLTSDPRRIIFQGPKLWTLNRSREKKKQDLRKLPPTPCIRFEKWWASPVSQWRFLFKDCRPTLQYMTIHCRSFAGYDLYKSYIYMLYYTYSYIHSITLHYIALHSIPLLIGGSNHLEKWWSSSLGISWDYEIPN